MTTNRETWLNELAALMAPRFEELGYKLPKFRVAVGWTSAGKSSQVGGECWHKSRSADGTFEILIAPISDDSMYVASVLAHELDHAAVGFECGHRGAFKTLALALGLEGKMTATKPGPKFKEWVQPFLDQLGKIPHARIILMPQRQPRDGDGADVDGGDDVPERGSSNAKPKQSTRLLKCSCQDEGCGYNVRITKKWLDEVGAPHCPIHGEMRCDEAPAEAEAA